MYKEIVDIKCGEQENRIVPMMLVGNKSDDTANRIVTTHTGESMAEQMNCAFIEVCVLWLVEFWLFLFPKSTY